MQTSNGELLRKVNNVLLKDNGMGAIFGLSILASGHTVTVGGECMKDSAVAYTKRLLLLIPGVSRVISKISVLLPEDVPDDGNVRRDPVGKCEILVAAICGKG